MVIRPELIISVVNSFSVFSRFISIQVVNVPKTYLRLRALFTADEIACSTSMFNILLSMVVNIYVEHKRDQGKILSTRRIEILLLPTPPAG